MKRNFFVSVAIVFAIMLFAIGTSAQGQTSRPIELKFAHWLSTMHDLHTDIYIPFAKEIEERTKGRVKIVIYPAEALGKAKDHYDMAVRGIADITIHMPGYTPGRFPLSSVVDLPIQISSARVGSLVFNDLYHKYLKTEYPGVKVLWSYTTDPFQFMMRKKTVKTVADLKGLRMRSGSPQMTAFLRDLSVSPINMPVSEVYESLQRGLLDGAFTSFTALRSFKLFEVVGTVTVANVCVGPSVIVMNPKSWEKLPKDIQNIFDEVTSTLPEKTGANFDKYVAMSKDLLKKAGGEIHEFPPQETKLLMERFSTSDEKWIAEMEGKGLPGRKVYDEARALAEKYSRQSN
jgi:TRAP-type C4-dicarboxylate transport system substrate-binding protein